MHEKIPLDEIREIALYVLKSDIFNKYFSVRQLRDEVLITKYKIPLRELQQDIRYKDERLRVGKQLVYLFREFRKLNYIQKYSNRFWIIYKNNIYEGEKCWVEKIGID